MLRTLLFQRSMFEVDPDALRLASDSFERHLPELVSKLVSPDDFRGFYSETNGAGSRCPLMLVAMLLLQYRYEVSDIQLVERCRRDLGWRYAIGLDVGDPPPSQATVQRFRGKLSKLKGANFLHGRTLELARDQQLLDDVALQAIDSTNVDCRGAVIDTYNLIATAICQVIRKTAQCLGRRADGLAERWGMRQYMARSIKGEAAIDWTDKTARTALLTDEVRAANTLPLLIAQLDIELPSEVDEALVLLARVVAQDTQQLGDGTYEITKGTVPDRVISITDPEARHGRKSKSKKINGFKVHVAKAITSQFVTGIHITDASVHDALPTMELIQQAESHGVKPEEAVADAAYGTGQNIRICAENGVKILTKLPAPSHKGSLSKSSFTIDLQAGTVTCPAGQTTAKATRTKADGDSSQQVDTYHFDKTTCQACPLKDACCSQTRAGRNRKIRLSLYEVELQTRKTFNASPRAKGVLRSRSSIERLISHLVRMGMRQARFFGMHRVQAQAHMTAAAYNLQRCITLLAERKRGGWA